MPLMRLGEGPSLPTPSVLAVAAQPTAEVEIQDSTIWDGSSDGESLVRPNNGRHVASRIGDTVRDRSVYYGRFSVLSEDTANSVHSGTRRLSLMSGGVPVTQLDAVSPHEAPMEASQFNLAQSDTVSLVTEPEDGFDDDPAEEDDVVSEGGLEILSDQESEVEIPFRLPGAMARRRGFESLDGVSLVQEFDERACLMKTVPRFLKGPYRIALRTALEETNVEDLGRQELGWKLFLLLPRLLLHQGPRGGTIAKQKLLGRFEKFNSGAWLDLLEESRKVTHEAAQVRRRRNRRTEDDLTRRVSRAEALVHMGEVSSARQALEGASLAPGSEATLNALRDPAKRPPEPRTPLPRDLSNPVALTPFKLDQWMLLRNM